jgi:hypothetical protein
VKPSLLPTSRPLFQARRLGARFLTMAFRSDVWFLPIARDIEADLMWDSPSRASFGKVGSIMKRLRVPIYRHADGQLTEVLRKIVLVVPYCHPCCSRVPAVIE